MTPHFNPLPIMGEGAPFDSAQGRLRAGEGLLIERNDEPYFSHLSLDPSTLFLRLFAGRRSVTLRRPITLRNQGPRKTLKDTRSRPRRLGRCLRAGDQKRGLTEAELLAWTHRLRKIKSSGIKDVHVGRSEMVALLMDAGLHHVTHLGMDLRRKNVGRRHVNGGEGAVGGLF